VPAAAVVDSKALGKRYTSPVTLARFEADAGTTNRGNVRMELKRRVRRRADRRGRENRGELMPRKPTDDKTPKAKNQTPAKKKPPPASRTQRVARGAGRRGRR
jgi:hypothetical protein